MLDVVTPPITEPVSLSEVKDYLRLGGSGEAAASEDDTLFTGLLIPAARAKAERSLRIFLAAATYDLTLQTGDSLIRLGRIGIESITSVTLHADDGDTVLDAADYVFRGKADPCEIEIVNGVDHYAVTVRFVSATPAYVPRDVKLAICYLIHHWYENREAWISTGAVPQTQPESYTRIIHHHKRHRL